MVLKETKRKGFVLFFLWGGGGDYVSGVTSRQQPGCVLNCLSKSGTLGKLFGYFGLQLTAHFREGPS